MKQCSMCKEILPETAFGSDKSKKDGLRARCRECANAYQREQKRRSLVPGDPRHGTENGVTNFSCACKPCKAKRAELSGALRRSGLKRGLEPNDPRHGTCYGYARWGCRCSACCKAQAAYMRFQKYEWSNEAEEAFDLAQACDLCHKPFNSNNRHTGKAVDHDHVHGFVRGVIHHRCNMDLNDGGRDTIQMLEDALAAGDHQTANYLLKTVQTI